MIPKNNIAINFNGGIGNRLFQLFAAFAYSIRNKCPFKISKTDAKYWSQLFSRLNLPIDHSKYTEYYEPDYKFKFLPWFNKDVKLHGYFQSERYFKNEYQKIIDLIGLRWEQDRIKKKYQHLLDGWPASLHVRRGDYRKYSDCHPLLPDSYYEATMQQIDGKVLCFCEEDIQPLIDNLSNKYANKFIKIDDSISDWEQLLLMSCCRDNIIANSTFSWWAAYFNENTNKKVLYPSLWFGPALNHDTSTLFPKNWQKIEVKNEY